MQNKIRHLPRELNLIENLIKVVRRYHPRTLVPIGDDAFVFKSFSENTVLCQDLLVENVHFKTDYFTASDLGHKALAVNLSDLAAMGASAHFAQVSLAIPASISEQWLLSFYSGMTALADKYQTEIVGGDLSLSPGPVVIDVSAIGEVSTPFTRGGAQSGDLIAVTGCLGTSQAGLMALQRQSFIHAEAMQKHLRPLPRLDVAAILRQHKIDTTSIHAMMDCSDGLINDLLHITRNLSLGVEIDIQHLPIASDTQDLAAQLKQSAVDWALWGGEDYELLLAVPPEKKDFLKYIFETENTDLHFIGRLTSSGKIQLIHPNTQTSEVTEFKGWRHF